MNFKNKPYIIAEIAQAHEGSLGILYSYIDAIATTGVDAVKFQMHIAAAESSEHEPFRVKFSKEDKTRFDYWKRMEFTFDQWVDIKTYCTEKGLDFLCSPFSNLAVDWLEKLDVFAYKIGSGEVNNLLLLEKIAQTKKPVILSSGMSSFDELDQTTQFLSDRNIDFSIMQCTTAYPTSPENYGLQIIEELKKRYNVTTGFSDHSARISTCIAATALGAEILEFHVVFDRRLFGPDTIASLTIDETKLMVAEIRAIAKSLNTKVDKTNNDNFTELKNIFEKSLAINKNLPKNHLITFDDLEAKKPKNYGINAQDFEKVIGKKLNKDMNQWSFLNNEDLE